MRVLRFLFSNLDHFRIRFFVVFFAAFADGVALFFIPLLLADFTNRGLASPRELAVWLGLAYVSSLAFQYLLRRVGEALCSEYSLHLREKLLMRIEHVPVSTLKAHHSGTILSLVGTVADGVAGLTNELFWGVAKSLSTLTLFFYFTSRESLELAIANGLILICFVSLSTYLARRMVPYAAELNLARASYFGRFTDFMQNILTVRRLGLFGFVKRSIGEKQDIVVSEIRSLQRFHAGRWFLLHALFGAAYVGTIIFLLFRVSSGQASIGSLILFVGAYAIIRGLAERLSEDWKTLIEQQAYLRTLEEVCAPEERETKNLLSQWQRIEIQSGEVHFDSQILRYPGFALEKGERIFVCGESGQGKSTLLQVLAGSLPLSKGEFRIDQHLASGLSPEFFRTHCALLSQEVELFNLSLRENINLEREIPDVALRRYAAQLGLLEWIESLPLGFDTVVGEKGIRISSGQKQRVNLLRTLSLDRELYLLDEPTAHLDPHTEERAIEFLECVLASKTAVIVSHRPALRALCSRSYLMRGSALILEER